MTSSSATTREKPSELRRKFLKCEAVGIYGSSVRYSKAFFEYGSYVCETVDTSRAVVSGAVELELKLSACECRRPKALHGPDTRCTRSNSCIHPFLCEKLSAPVSRLYSEREGHLC